jgi:hypothetical protein
MRFFVAFQRKPLWLTYSSIAIGLARAPTVPAARPHFWRNAGRNFRNNQALDDSGRRVGAALDYRCGDVLEKEARAVDELEPMAPGRQTAK